MVLDIMLPYWGDPAMAKKTIQSVIEQDGRLWNLTVIDDCYPDPTLQNWLKELGHQQITYIRNERNLGISGNFQRSVELAENEFLCILGSDDLLLPNFVSSTLTLLQDCPQADVIQSGVVVIDGNGQEILPLGDRVKRWLRPSAKNGPRVLNGEKLAASLMQADWLYFPSLVFRRKLLLNHKFSDRYAFIQDLALLSELILHGAIFLLEDTQNFAYRRHNASASMAHVQDGGRFQGEREFFQHAANMFANAGWNKASRAAKIHLTSRLYALVELLKLIIHGHVKGSGRLLRHAFGR